MISRLKMFFFVFSITASTILSALDNPIKPIIEILKAPGIAQEKLGYRNDIKYLIDNGNTWTFVTALGLKYGYNHFGDKSFRNLGIAGTTNAVSDLTQYSKIAKMRYESLINEQKSQTESLISKTKKFELGRDGLIQIIGSMIAYKFLGLAIINPLKVIFLGCIAYAGITGGKKVYDAYKYEKYLANEIENTNYMKTILSRAREQLENNAVQNMAQDAKQTLLTIKNIAQDNMQDLAQKTQDKIKQLKEK